MNIYESLRTQGATFIFPDDERKDFLLGENKEDDCIGIYYQDIKCKITPWEMGSATTLIYHYGKKMRIDFDWGIGDDEADYLLLLKFIGKFNKYYYHEDGTI